MKIAAIQMTSGPVLEDNIATVQRLIGQAVTEGVRLVLLPEYWPLMGMRENDKLLLVQGPQAGIMTDFMSQQARQHGIYLIGGTIPMVSPEPDKVYNTTLVFDPQGEQVARYDKIHLFGFSNGSESYQESRSILAGTRPVSFEAAEGEQSGASAHFSIGLSICYDLRFPELYRSLKPVDLLVVPAAFTYTTGSAHWEILLRARAIENQCYVLACGQTGHHPNGRHTWGHSMLIDPWGKIVAQRDDGEGVIAGELDCELIRRIRQNLPALQHRILA